MHSVQVEEGLHPFLQRIGQASAPFVRPWAETLVKSTPEFANATLNVNTNCQMPIIVEDEKKAPAFGARDAKPPIIAGYSEKCYPTCYSSMGTPESFMEK